MRVCALGLAGLVATVLGYAVPCGAVEVVYQGEGCGCAKTLGFSVQRPCAAEATERRFDVGYQVVVPPEEPPQTPSYSFDFHIEVPQPKEEILL